MEDKKVKAGSLAVGICLFIIAILLVVIVFVFYNSTTIKNNLQLEVDELKISLEEKDKKVEELEDKISKVSDVIKNDEETDIEKECKVAFESYFDLREEMVSGGSLYALKFLGLISTTDKQYETITYGFDDFYKTDIKYLDFKKAIGKYVTEEFLKKEFEEKCVKNIDGYLHITAMGGTAKYIDIEKFELSSNNENSCVFNLLGEQRYDDGAPKESVRIKIIFEKQDKNYIIAMIEYM